MKCIDIVQQLAALLPSITDKFTTNFNVTSLTRSSTTVTCVTSVAHGLTVGQQINIVGAQTPLTIVALTRSGLVGTLVTDNNHDMTEGFSKNVELSGSAEPEFNGTFTLLTAPNRKTITFTMLNSGPTIATGAPLLLNGSSELQSYGGLHNITVVPDATSFEYEITNTSLYSPASGVISARTNPRVAGAAQIERAALAYTKQSLGQLWIFVVLGSVFASKSRDIESDAVDNLQFGTHYRQQVVQPFSVYVLIPAKTTIAGRESRDEAEEIFPLLCRALLFSKLDSQLFAGAQNPIIFSDHNLFAYDSATYVHVYNFQSVADIYFEDTVGYAVDVAFRDVDLTINLDVGTGVATAKIDLDDIIL